MNQLDLMTQESIACVQPAKITLHSRSQEREKKKRTVTSYDTQTSDYLKSVFFEIYSCQNKLTKQQRFEVQRRTGLPSRNITYWFSNHKRRFKDTLKIYRNTVKASNGAIKSYRDFVEYRIRQGLPEHITQEELNVLQRKKSQSLE
ncbi:hypothetical protein A0J61_06865 [Choanephora cucurbitarum]|uniref:Homeobox domain-containing protein n=1 Tax=Choanephora cucurbitarum TaxID=101091 RepID=A0A1C7N7H5_9FUNG|nr:hypothetical protein A0J61_06865 [Choanephora cucurbitarum]